ncbi:MAG: UDP-N-acetylmuramoyl-tripeptide--D-alanyl-D-alanine ligase [Firmicutes bacterium]|nr:UDP-N-acetylmuramoyl-tripeptide--D-alanyl-D-alanine ligase [Bacillota bacterium]
MIPLTVEEIADSTEGIIISGSPNIKVTGISVDSRAISSGYLFVPLKGTTDGHAYITDALKKGASGFLVESNANEKEKLVKLSRSQFVIEVRNTLKALQSIAAYYRTKLSAKVIGITGSTGKTTTKDMLNCILSKKARVVCTEKNFNNELGVPLTILRADQNTEVLIIEMAMRGRGQIKELAEIARPNIGVITNIGQAHIEILGSEKEIAAAKAELIECIPRDGVAVLNADDLWTENIASVACSKIITFGIADGDIRGTEIDVDELGRPTFRLHFGREPAYVVRLSIPGKHNVYNALAVAAVALEMGYSIDDIRVGLSGCRPSAMRMEIFATDDNVLILNDTYNANPISMQAALSTLIDISTAGRHIAVLGDMLELGHISNEAHKEIGEMVASLGVDVLIAVGNESRVMAESATKAGMSAKSIITCLDSGTAARILKQLITPGDVVLVKGSRGVGLEVVVKELVKI